MITKTNFKAKITQGLAAVFFALFILPTVAVFIPTSSNTASASLNCQSKYTAYKQNGSDSKESPTWKAWDSCLTGLALEWCGSRDHWQAGNQSDDFKKDTCVYWYRAGFNKPRGTVCQGSHDPSGNNQASCQHASGVSLNYAAVYAQAQEDGTPRENPRDSDTNTEGGGTPSGGDIDAAPTVPQKDLPESQDPALKCAAKDTTNTDCDLVKKYINPIIGFLSAFVGIAVTIGIISGGIRYASSTDDPQKASAGRQMIRNSLIALVAYIFLFAFMKWILPQAG